MVEFCLKLGGSLTIVLFFVGFFVPEEVIENNDVVAFSLGLLLLTTVLVLLAGTIGWIWTI